MRAEHNELKEMKTFKMVGMALIAILMGVGFASCNKDNHSGGENGVVDNDKKLTKLSLNGDTYISFIYDDEGRLVEAKEVDGADYSFTETFTWGDNAVKISSKELYNGEEYNSSYTLPLANGLVQSHQFNSTQYTTTYSQSNRLVEWGKDRDKTSIIWDADKLVSATNDYYGHIYDYTLTYEKSCKKGYFPLLGYLIGIGHGSYLYYAHPELLGLRTTQLSASVTTVSDSRPTEKVTYSYELNTIGYISKITVTEENSESYTYTLTWE